MPKATGVRRLNRKPLLFVMLLGVLAMFGLIYGVSSRSAASRPKTTDADQVDAPKAQPAKLMTAEQLFGPPTSDVIEAAPPKPLAPPLAPTTANGVIPAVGSSAPKNTTLAPLHADTKGGLPAMTPEQKETYDAIRAARVRKQQLYESALTAPTRVAAVADNAARANTPSTSGIGFDDASVRSEAMARIAALQQSLTGGAQVEDQAAKNAFLDRQVATTTLAARRRPQQHPYDLKMGTVIPGVMVSGINSDLPGQIVGQVAQDVYDSAVGQTLLIPQGSKLVGSYDSRVAFGQSRILVAWYRINFPDGSTLDLGGMPGADSAGYAGFKDRVNHHWASLFGGALLMSAVSAGVQVANHDDSPSMYGQRDVGDEIASALAQQFGQLGTEIARKQLNVQPTIEIRPGLRFNIMVTKDVVLEPYER